MALYRTGTAAMSAAGKITGTGTKWKQALSLIRTGATIVLLPGGVPKFAVISEIISDTEMNAIATDGGSVANSPYVIFLNDSLTVDGMAQDVAETLRYYQSKETVIQDAIDFFENYDFDKLKVIADQIKANADAAKASETNAKTSETNAKTSENAANTSNNAAAWSATAAATGAATATTKASEAAKSAQEAANSAASTAYVTTPFPDVWAPLSDDLRLLAGNGTADSITISGTSYPLPSKSIKFSRAGTATYVDKSGVLQAAAANTPRFEKEGLLIEAQSTNLFDKASNTSFVLDNMTGGTQEDVAYPQSGCGGICKKITSTTFSSGSTTTVGATLRNIAIPDGTDVFTLSLYV